MLTRNRSRKAPEDLNWNLRAVAAGKVGRAGLHHFDIVMAFVAILLANVFGIVINLPIIMPWPFDTGTDFTPLGLRVKSSAG